MLLGIVTIFDSSDNPLTASAVENPYLFTGRRFDPESGNYYYRARIYSPTLGRFLQTDPLGYVDGLNLYAYVGNNPASWVDPYGLYAYEIDWGQVLDTLVNTGKTALTAAEAALAGALTDAAAVVGNPVAAAVAVAGAIIFYPVPAGDPEADENASLLPSFVVPESNTCPLNPPFPGYPGVYPEPVMPGYPGIDPELLVETIPVDGPIGPTTHKATDSSKAEPHGDDGRELEKIQERIEELKEEIKKAPNKTAKNKIKKKIQNITKDAQKKKKGTTDWRSKNKRQR